MFVASSRASTRAHAASTVTRASSSRRAPRHRSASFPRRLPRPTLSRTTDVRTRTRPRVRGQRPTRPVDVSHALAHARDVVRTRETSRARRRCRRVRCDVKVCGRARRRARRRRMDPRPEGASRGLGDVRPTASMARARAAAARRHSSSKARSARRETRTDACVVIDRPTTSRGVGRHRATTTTQRRETRVVGL